MLLAAPLFTLLDRPTGESTAGVEASYVEYGHFSGTLTASHGEAHVEIVDPGTGLGGYVRAPIAHMYGDPPNYSGTAYDDVEVGGVLSVHRPDGLDVVLHAGFAFSTASRTDDLVPLVWTGGVRAQDFVLGIPHGNTVRLGVSPRLRSGPYIAGADLGLDLNTSNYTLGDLGSTQSVDYGPIVHVDAAVGYAIPRFVVTAEVTSVRVQPTEMAASGWRFMGAIAMRFPVGRVAPYAALLLPLRDDGITYNHITFGATAGVDVALF